MLPNVYTRVWSITVTREIYSIPWFGNKAVMIGISKSLNDLLYTDMLLIDLFIKRGFTDLRSDNRAFKKIYETSPVQYRRKYSEIK